MRASESWREKNPKTVWWNDEIKAEDRDGKKGSELPKGWERVEIAWPLVCR